MSNTIKSSHYNQCSHKLINNEYCNKCGAIYFQDVYNLYNYYFYLLVIFNKTQ